MAFMKKVLVLSPFPTRQGKARVGTTVELTEYAANAMVAQGKAKHRGRVIFDPREHRKVVTPEEIKHVAPQAMDGERSVVVDHEKNLSEARSHAEKWREGNPADPDDEARASERIAKARAEMRALKMRNLMRTGTKKAILEGLERLGGTNLTMKNTKSELKNALKKAIDNG
jgi:hypothetical protein